MSRAYTPQEWQFLEVAVQIGYAQGSAIQWWDEGFEESEKQEILAALGKDHARITVKDVITRYHDRNKAAVDPTPAPPTPPAAPPVQQELMPEPEEDAD